jgi:predicted transcriptional regulator
MKEKGSRKGNIISIRMSDEERDAVQKLMDARNKKASFIMREALTLFKEQWEMSRRMENPIEN